MHQAFSHWSEHASRSKNYEASAILKRNLNTLDVLKQKIAQFEA